MALIEQGGLYDAFTDTFGGMELITLESALGLIDDAPTIDAAPVAHGQWIECDDDIYTLIECSECGFEQDIDDCGEHPHEAEDYMLCPACGARMNGGGRHEAG